MAATYLLQAFVIVLNPAPVSGNTPTLQTSDMLFGMSKVCLPSVNDLRYPVDVVVDVSVQKIDMLYR